MGVRRISQFRHPATVRQHVRARDKYGDLKSTGTTVVAEPMVAVQALTGTERLLAQQVNPDVAFRIKMRYQDGIDASQELWLDDGRRFFIDSVINLDERDEELHLMCKAIP